MEVFVVSAYAILEGWRRETAMTPVWWTSISVPRVPCSLSIIVLQYSSSFTCELQVQIQGILISTYRLRGLTKRAAPAAGNGGRDALICGLRFAVVELEEDRASTFSVDHQHSIRFCLRHDESTHGTIYPTYQDRWPQEEPDSFCQGVHKGSIGSFSCSCSNLMS